ncbi:MAG: hypothetical protein MAG431_02503 [Chloroflexi bacterium]|nr:hypothetical protein [Chloroflexota bacterium]
MMAISTQMTSGVSKRLTGWAFILWGIHKADFPFLRTVTWFAPWGFILSAVAWRLTPTPPPQTYTPFP